MRLVSFVMIAAFDLSCAAEPPTVEKQVVFTGNHGCTSDELRALMTHPVDEPSGLERDLLLLSSYYLDRGYANVRVVTPRVDVTTITIPIDEGPIFTLGAVTATGELIGDEHANLAKVRVRSGSVFSRAMIARDRESLIAYYKDHGYPNASVEPLSKIDPARTTIDLDFEIVRATNKRR